MGADGWTIFPALVIEAVMKAAKKESHHQKGDDFAFTSFYKLLNFAESSFSFWG